MEDLTRWPFVRAWKVEAAVVFSQKTSSHGSCTTSASGSSPYSTSRCGARPPSSLGHGAEFRSSLFATSRGIATKQPAAVSWWGLRRVPRHSSPPYGLTRGLTPSLNILSVPVSYRVAFPGLRVRAGAHPGARERCDPGDFFDKAKCGRKWADKSRPFPPSHLELIRRSWQELTRPRLQRLRRPKPPPPKDQGRARPRDEGTAENNGGAFCASTARAASQSSTASASTSAMSWTKLQASHLGVRRECGAFGGPRSYHTDMCERLRPVSTSRCRTRTRASSRTRSLPAHAPKRRRTSRRSERKSAQTASKAQRVHKMTVNSTGARCCRMIRALGCNSASSKTSRPCMMARRSAFQTSMRSSRTCFD